ncbi:hypothetical protein EQZ98_03530 [Leuconostoc mesenteroides]|uniref:hypothetical protein n=1 Tax=Leuconostoc mesenteroides TaxID=1245 RepID=UPI000FFE220B|nr:hypothetical protein [Leuconostoc mesenteroides]QAT27251.1 hypothetical protein EQZ98_03530 [Leuconostoc mesenteroides]
MTEPVLYLVNGVAFNDIDRAKVYSDVLKYHKKIAVESLVPIPLYTAEQLHPRVKMTQAEFDEFHDLFEKDFDLYSAITEIADTNLRITLYDRLFTGTQKDKDRQNEFAILWANYNPLEPEETIEIVQNMKWFVRSKEQYEPDMDQGISESGYLYLTQGDIYSIEYHEMTTFKDEATQFNTEDEAKTWTTPLTEAVQLAVEDE